MSNGKRRYFPGANTGRGFIGHFEGIVPPWSEPHYTYVLKGGPGVGKSTLMKIRMKALLFSLRVTAA